MAKLTLRVDEAVIRRAKGYAARRGTTGELLVTRDPAGFRDAPLPVTDPSTALALLSGEGPDEVAEGRPAPSRRRARGSPRRRRRLASRRPPAASA